MRAMNPQRTDHLRVREALATVHGNDIADLCMDMMQTIDLSHLATRDDVHVLRTELNQLRHDMDTKFARLRNEMDTKFAELRNDMDAGFAQLRHDFAEHAATNQAWMVDRINISQRWNIGMVVSVMGVIMAASKLL